MDIKAGEFKVYKYRWVVLIVYLLSALTIQMLWTTFFSITLESVRYYGFGPESGETPISLLSIIFMVGMIALSIPSMAAFEKLGYKKSVGLGVALMAVAALVRGLFGDNYTMLVVCTVVFAVAQPFILNSVGIVPGKWFPVSERATANGLGLMSNYIGMMVGLLVTPVLLESGMSIKNILIIYGIWSVIVGAAFVLLTKEAPPTPPCAEEESLRSDFGEGLKTLMKKPPFIFMILGFFLVLGVFNVFFTLIEPILKHFSGGTVDSLQAGLIGVIILITGIVGSIVIPVLSDKSKGQRRKPFILVFYLLGCVGYALFLLMSDFNGILVAAIMYGLFAVGVAPVIMTMSAEISYPVSEGTSEGLLMFAGNVAGVIFLGIAGIIGSNYSALMLLLAIVMFVAWVLYLFAKEIKKQDNATTQA